MRQAKNRLTDLKAQAQNQERREADVGQSAQNFGEGMEAERDAEEQRF